ncbi:phage tail domain-containing protein [Bacillus siamensis]|uniref:phage tail domain-containing protein n=1 Tax=Bacillus siamensis TaxID=659243 RepID=UPI000647D55E|nr:phage tail domain-containing protein [Bacillus siamensis]
MKKSDLIIDGMFLSEHLKGVSLSSFRPESPSYERQTTFTHSLVDGTMTYRKGNKGRLNDKKITATFTIIASNSQQFDMKRDEIYDYLSRPDPYYVIYSPQPLKRWLVTCDDSYSVFRENGKKWKEFDVTFTAIQGAAESVYDSTASMNLADNMFHLGMNIGRDSNPVYHFKNRSTFTVENIGNVTIDPYRHNYNVEMYLEGKDITITNLTNNDTVTLVGTQSKSNKLSLFSHHIVNGTKVIETRNGRFPTLEKGQNKFKITGATYSDIKFITHFYYK